jgi:hypothetical protein
MSIANTEQAEHWNVGEAVAHWIDNQARYEGWRHHPAQKQRLRSRPGNREGPGCAIGARFTSTVRLPSRAAGLVTAPWLRPGFAGGCGTRLRGRR